MSSGNGQSTFPFKFLRLLGKGTSAQVWLARHRASDHDVALKVFNVQGRSSNQVEEFFRETRFVARAAHRNILEVWGYGQASESVEFGGEVVLAVDQLYLVSEYVSGGSLDAQAGELDWSQIRAVLIDLLLGLARVHARGIVHLDLKPANVLLSERGALISDFGVAAPILSAELTQRDGGLFGTPSFMAPEQGVSHTHVYGPWTDLYGLGCLAVVLITGRTPYTTNGLVEQLIAHRSEPIPLLEARYNVPKGFDLWLAGMMNKSWSRRFQRAVEARLYLESLDSNPLSELMVSSFVHLRNEALEPEHTIVEKPSYEFQTVRLAVGQALHSAQQDVKEGLPFAETIIVPYEQLEQNSRSTTRLKGMGNSLIGIEDARLVGRSTEKQALWSRFSQYQNHPQSGAVQISASAGMGKSALCDWFCTAANEFVGAEVLWFTHAPTMGPSDGVLNAFKGYFSLFGVEKEQYTRLISQRLCLGEEDALVTDLTRVFETLFVDESTLEHGYVLSLYERFSILSQLMIYLAVRRPMVVIVDDVQWAFDTLQFLIAYVNHSASTAIFIVETCQSDAKSIPDRLHQLRTQLHEQLSWTHAMLLSPLERQIVIDWFEQMGEVASPSQALVDSVAGNPLSIKALLYTAGAELSDEDVLAHPSLEMLLGRQFALWQKRTRHMSVLGLQVLAVLGRVSSIEEWMGVMVRLGYEPDVDVLNSAIRGQLIERNAQNQFIFAHRAILDSALGALSQEQAVRIHSETARFLEDEPSPDYARVAVHYTVAQTHATASERWFRTALLYRDRTDYPNFRWALIQSAKSLRAARVQPEDGRWVELSIYWVLCRRVMGEARGVGRRCKMTVHRAMATADNRLIAMALREEARLNRVLAGYAEALATMSKALKVAEKTSLVDLQTVLRTDLAFLSLHVGQIEASQLLLQTVSKSLDEGFERQNLHHAVEFFQVSAQLASRCGNHEEALHYAMASYSAVEDSPSKRSRGHALNLLGEAQRAFGLNQEAIESYAAAADCYCAIESIDTPITFLNQGFIYCELEDYEAALECVIFARRWLGSSSMAPQVICDFMDGLLHLMLDELDVFDAYAGAFKTLAKSTWGEGDIAAMAEIGFKRSIERRLRGNAERCLQVFENQVRRIGDGDGMTRGVSMRKMVNRLPE